jgi:predicted O-methyltransferase YrrM
MKANTYLIKAINGLKHKQFFRFLLHFLSLRKIQKLKEDLPQEYKLIGSALEEAFSNRISTNEEKWIKSIEDLRNNLFVTSDSIEIEDFGAGEWLLKDKHNEDSHNTKKSVNLMCWLSAKPPVWCLFLMKLIRAFRPAVCLELGTNLGISAAYQAAALQLAGRGRLYTIEGSQNISDIAVKNFEKLGLNNITLTTGVFKDTLPGILKNLSTLDFVFIDGHHDGQATISYYKQIKHYLNKPSLIIFDDIYWSIDMKKAWQKIKSDQDLDLCLDLLTLGVCIYNPSFSEKRLISIPLI